MQVAEEVGQEVRGGNAHFSHKNAKQAQENAISEAHWYKACSKAQGA